MSRDCYRDYIDTPINKNTDTHGWEYTDRRTLDRLMAKDRMLINNQANRQTDGQTVRQIDGWTYRKTSRKTDRRTNKRMNENPDRKTNGWTDGRIYSQTDGWMDKHTDGRTNRKTNDHSLKKAIYTIYTILFNKKTERK